MADKKIIEKDIAVAPVEYVTKYSLNRNFMKLVENDKLLSARISNKSGTDTGRYVQSYLPLRIYNAGDCVFYKTSEDSQSLYMLCSVVNDNSYAPLTAYDSTSSIIVISDEHWKIAGLNDEISANPKDYATEYLTWNKAEFLSVHQENTDLSAHPTKELGIDKSTVAFTSFDNIEDNRKTFFYPSHLETLTPDNSIIGGYMRRWDDGLLEYDVMFRVGYGGEKSDTGLDLISANNLDVYHRNDNNLYFRDNADFKIFNQGKGYFSALNGIKQVNLNTDVNAYYAEVKFPQEFKDLNYMVFTSNVKNVDIESFNLKNEVLSGQHDERLLVTGLDITGHVEDADWTRELVIPLSAKSISKDALSFIKETNSTELKVKMLSGSSLLDIGDNAFDGSDIREIVIPKNVKCIGSGAFASCEKLANVTMYISKEISEQPVLDYNVFTGCTSLNRITLQYYDKDDIASHMLMTKSPDQIRQEMYTSTEDLYDKLNDAEIRGLYGIGESVTISAVNRPDYAWQKQYAEKPVVFSVAQPAEVVDAKDNADVNFITIDVKQFLADLNKKIAKKAEEAVEQNSIQLLAANVQQNDASISCGNLSGKMFTYDSLSSLTMTGEDIPDCSVSAKSIGTLSLSGFSILSSQVISVENIDVINIIPSNDGLKMCNGALAGVSANTLCIDMTDAYLDVNALCGLSTNDIVLMNFAKAHVKPYVDRTGLGLKSFAGCNVKSINVLSDDLTECDTAALHELLSSNIQHIADGCSINGNALRTMRDNAIMKPMSRHLFIDHVDDAYVYSAVSCNWKEIIADFKLTQKDFTSKNAAKDVCISIPEGVESICSNAFSTGLQSIFKNAKGKMHSPVTCINVVKSVKYIAEDAFDNTPNLKELNFN